mmetsp:Transcript_8468/g.29897  ORF Transcript_8468/g.29897 Transcript_8468/m.29897 type:complete len:210 (+) Transcript_8468:586-1215(+)
MSKATLQNSRASGVNRAESASRSSYSVLPPPMKSTSLKMATSILTALALVSLFIVETNAATLPLTTTMTSSALSYGGRRAFKSPYCARSLPYCAVVLPPQSVASASFGSTAVYDRFTAVAAASPSTHSTMHCVKTSSSYAKQCAGWRSPIFFARPEPQSIQRLLTASTICAHSSSVETSVTSRDGLCTTWCRMAKSGTMCPMGALSPSM